VDRKSNYTHIYYNQIRLTNCCSFGLFFILGKLETLDCFGFCAALNNSQYIVSLWVLQVCSFLLTKLLADINSLGDTMSDSNHRQPRWPHYGQQAKSQHFEVDFIRRCRSH
jgi:hypothetical protein